MSGLMFSEMFGVLEHLTALLATVLVSRHGIPPTESRTSYWPDTASDARQCSSPF
jgi:hypothetical protein